MYIRFDEKLKVALGINVVGTREILNLAKEMINLKAFVHVSTAFAFCTNQEIEEKVYPTIMTAEHSIKLAESLDEEALEQLTPQMLGKWPNTYTYTKALAEDYVKTHGKGLPITIFRPAIVIPTSREPIVGWIDNMYGPSGIVLGVAAGLLRVMLIDSNQRTELVPVDYCVNSLLQSAYDVAKNSYEEPPVYNYVIEKENAMTWNSYMKYLEIYCDNEFPPLNTLWYHSFTMTQNWFLMTVLTFLYHTLPGAIMDVGFMICGKKPK
jgi:alcohol-forming fatty acyl-CoA reductase